MKTKMRALFTALCVMCLSACFSSWGAEEEDWAALNIVIADEPGGLVDWKGNEHYDFIYEVKLKQGNETIIKSFKGKSAVLNLPSGEYEILMVKAYKVNDNGDMVLRGRKKVGETVTVKAGKTSSISSIEMVTATEVDTWTKLQKAIEFHNDDIDIGSYPFNEYEEFIIINNYKDDFTPGVDTLTIAVKRRISLITENEDGVTITRNSSVGSGFFFLKISGGGELTLGEEGGYPLTIQGKGIGTNVESSLINVENGGCLVMHDGVTLKDNNSGQQSGSAVYVDGTFIMYGGTIENNGNSQSGGGVCVSGIEATFTMYGGIISNNNAEDSGGGVYVNTGATFTMEGGTITGNSAKNGGGVHNYSGTFTMHGGTITDNTAYYGRGGGGVYNNNGTFIMNSGTITGNTAESGSGGGVYCYDHGTFTMYGGTITGNTANSGSGGGVYISFNTTFELYYAEGAEDSMIFDNIIFKVNSWDKGKEVYREDSFSLYGIYKTINVTTGYTKTYGLDEEDSFDDPQP